MPPVEKDTSDITCFCCGEKVHYSSKCEKKDEIPKEKWFMNKEKGKSSEKKVGWSSTQVIRESADVRSTRNSVYTRYIRPVRQRKLVWTKT